VSKTLGLGSRRTAAALLLAVLALVGIGAAHSDTAHRAVADSTATSADVTAPANTWGPS
jgi:hypothetical protein